MSKLGFNGLMDLAIEESLNQFGEDFNNGENSDFYKLTASLMPMFVYLEDKAVSIKRDMNIYTAQGQALDDIINNDIFPRVQGSRAKATCEITGTSSVYCAMGSVQVEAFNGFTYTNTTDGMTVDNTLDLEFECDEATEEGNIPINNIKSVIKAPSGITDVQNITPFIDGLSVENDYDYLARYQLSNSAETWVLASIIAEVKKVEGVKSADGDRNNTVNTVGTLPPKSIRIVVDGGETQEICEAIYSKIHTPATVGSESAEVELYQGKYETIRFDRPTTTAIDYEYNIIADKKDEILLLLDEYLNGLNIGDFVSTEEFRRNKIGDSLEYGIKGMAINYKRSGENSYVDFLQLDYDEKGEKGSGVEV